MSRKTMKKKNSGTKGLIHNCTKIHRNTLRNIPKYTTILKYYKQSTEIYRNDPKYSKRCTEIHMQIYNEIL